MNCSHSGDSIKVSWVACFKVTYLKKLSLQNWNSLTRLKEVKERTEKVEDALLSEHAGIKRWIELIICC